MNSLRESTGGGKAAITGDFVLLGSEVNPILKTLRQHGIEVTALHSHMIDDSPHLFFMHFWANDNAAKLAEGIRAALDLAPFYLLADPKFVTRRAERIAPDVTIAVVEPQAAGAAFKTALPVVDIGTGTGLVAAQAAAIVGSALSDLVERSEDPVAAARAYLTELKLACAAGAIAR